MDILSFKFPFESYLFFHFTEKVQRRIVMCMNTINLSAMINYNETRQIIFKYAMTAIEWVLFSQASSGIMGNQCSKPHRYTCTASCLSISPLASG